MPRIKVVNEFDEILHDVKIKRGTLFAQAALDNWPEGFPGLSISVLNSDGDVVTAEQALNLELREGETWTIVLRPQGPGFIVAAEAFMLAVSSSTWLQLALVAVSILGSYLLAPKLPSISSGYEWDDADSPQFFSAQSNRLRPGARLPEIFGIIRTWPDLLVEPWVRYYGDRQSISELYVVTNGHARISSVRLHEEDLDSLPSSGYTVYHPGDDWPADFPVWRTNTFVGSVELPGPNENIAQDGVFDIRTNGEIHSSVNGFFTASTSFLNRYITLSGPDVLPANRVVYKVTAIATDPNDTIIEVEPSPAEAQNNTVLTIRLVEDLALDNQGDPKFYDFTWIPVWRYQGGEGDYWIEDGFVSSIPISDPGIVGANMVDLIAEAEGPVSWKYVTSSAVPGGPSLSDYRFAKGDTSVPDSGYYIEWREEGVYLPGVPGAAGATSVFTVPGDTDSVEFDIEFSAGLYEQKAGKPPVMREVIIEMFYREVGDALWVNSETFAFVEKTRTPRRFTSEFTWPSSGFYEVYFARVTESVDDSGDYVAVDACQLIGLRGRQHLGPEVLNDTLDYTMVRVELSTQNVQQALRERRLNLLATRKLPDRRVDTTTPGELRRTITIRDAMLYTMIDQGGYDEDFIDKETLQDIHLELRDLPSGSSEFHGIVDQTMTLEDQLLLIGNVGRIISYRRGSQFYFNRLSKGRIPKFLFNSRNKTEPETRSMNFGDSNESTSIIVRFMDATDDYKEGFVQYPDPDLDPNTEINPEEQSLLGVTDPRVAARIAKFLWDKRKYERDTIELKVSDDGALCAPGDVIAVTDHLRKEAPIDGEILNIEGSVITFDRPIPPDDYVARITDREGDLKTALYLTVNNEDISLVIPEWETVVLPPSTSQVSLRYSFTPIEYQEFDLFYVLQVQPSFDGPVQISGMIYDERAYDADDSVVGIYKAHKAGR